MIWLSVICAALTLISALLAAKIFLMKKDIGTIGREFCEKLKNPTNSPIALSGRDSSLRKLAAEINEQLKILRARQLNYEQGDLQLKNAVSNISHDIRTPLTAICGYLDLLEAEEKSKDAERYLEIIKSRTETLKQLAEELFSYSVIASPDYDLPKERIAINAVLEECIAGYYSTLQKAGVTPEIAMSEKAVYRTVNRTALCRIFSNLISNAVKYGDGDLRICLTENCEISFSNGATGLSEIQVNKLFDRFYTVEAARNSTGLGLSIAKILVQQSGGNISASYKDGRLTISVVLPE